MIAKAKTWGNSLGIVIPKDIVEALDIKPGEEVDIRIEKRGNVLKELFGTLKTGKSAQTSKDELRKELWGA